MNQGNQPIVVVQNSETNTMGVVGFVFALIGLFTCGGGSLIGLPCSIAGMCNKRSSTGLATAGAIISGLQVLGWVGFVVWTFVLAAANSTVH